MGLSKVSTCKGIPTKCAGFGEGRDEDHPNSTTPSTRQSLLLGSLSCGQVYKGSRSVLESRKGGGGRRALPSWRWRRNPNRSQQLNLDKGGPKKGLSRLLACRRSPSLKTNEECHLRRRDSGFVCSFYFFSCCDIPLDAVLLISRDAHAPGRLPATCH